MPDRDFTRIRALGEFVEVLVAISNGLEAELKFRSNSVRSPKGDGEVGRGGEARSKCRASFSGPEYIIYLGT